MKLITTAEAIIVLMLLSIVSTTFILFFNFAPSEQYKQYKMKIEYNLPSEARNVKKAGNGWVEFTIGKQKFLQSYDFYGGKTVIEVNE
jgi:hypothetical protein